MAVNTIKKPDIFKENSFRNIKSVPISTTSAFYESEDAVGNIWSYGTEGGLLEWEISLIVRQSLQIEILGIRHSQTDHGRIVRHAQHILKNYALIVAEMRKIYDNILKLKSQLLSLLKELKSYDENISTYLRPMLESYFNLLVAEAACRKFQWFPRPVMELVTPRQTSEPTTFQGQPPTSSPCYTVWDLFSQDVKDIQEGFLRAKIDISGSFSQLATTPILLSLLLFVIYNGHNIFKTTSSCSQCTAAECRDIESQVRSLSVAEGNVSAVLAGASACGLYGSARVGSSYSGLRVDLVENANQLFAPLPVFASHAEARSHSAYLYIRSVLSKAELALVRLQYRHLVLPLPTTLNATSAAPTDDAPNSSTVPSIPGAVPAASGKASTLLPKPFLQRLNTSGTNASSNRSTHIAVASTPASAYSTNTSTNRSLSSHSHCQSQSLAVDRSSSGRRGDSTKGSLGQINGAIRFLLEVIRKYSDSDVDAQIRMGVKRTYSAEALDCIDEEIDIESFVSSISVDIEGIYAAQVPLRVVSGTVRVLLYVDPADRERDRWEGEVRSLRNVLTARSDHPVVSVSGKGGDREKERMTAMASDRSLVGMLNLRSTNTESSTSLSSALRQGLLLARGAVPGSRSRRPSLEGVSVPVVDDMMGDIDLFEQQEQGELGLGLELGEGGTGAVSTGVMPRPRDDQEASCGLNSPCASPGGDGDSALSGAFAARTRRTSQQSALTQPPPLLEGCSVESYTQEREHLAVARIANGWRAYKRYRLFKYIARLREKPLKLVLQRISQIAPAVVRSEEVFMRVSLWWSTPARHGLAGMSEAEVAAMMKGEVPQSSVVYGPYEVQQVFDQEIEFGPGNGAGNGSNRTSITSRMGRVSTSDAMRSFRASMDLMFGERERGAGIASASTQNGRTEGFESRPERRTSLQIPRPIKEHKEFSFSVGRNTQATTPASGKLMPMGPGRGPANLAYRSRFGSQDSRRDLQGRRRRSVSIFSVPLQLLYQPLLSRILRKNHAKVTSSNEQSGPRPSGPSQAGVAPTRNSKRNGTANNGTRGDSVRRSNQSADANKRSQNNASSTSSQPHAVSRSADLNGTVCLFPACSRFTVMRIEMMEKEKEMGVHVLQLGKLLGLGTKNEDFQCEMKVTRGRFLRRAMTDSSSEDLGSIATNTNQQTQAAGNNANGNGSGPLFEFQLLADLSTQTTSTWAEIAFHGSGPLRQKLQYDGLFARFREHWERFLLCIDDSSLLLFEDRMPESLWMTVPVASLQLDPLVKGRGHSPVILKMTTTEGDRLYVRFESEGRCLAWRHRIDQILERCGVTAVQPAVPGPRTRRSIVQSLSEALFRKSSSLPQPPSHSLSQQQRPDSRGGKRSLSLHQ